MGPTFTEMSDERSSPHDRLEGERQEAHDEASASVQDSNSGHVEVCSHTAQEEACDSKRLTPSPWPPTHEKAHDSEKSSPGPQPPPHDEAQEAEKPSFGPQPPTHEEAQDFMERPSRSSQPPVHEAHGSEKSSHSSQPPVHESHGSEKSSHSSQPPTHGQEQHASVKGPPIAKQKAQPVRANWQRDEEWERKEQERRRRRNERRLEGQRLEYERKVEARRKAEEAAAAARAQSDGGERSTNGGELAQPRSGSEEALRVRQRRQQQQSLMEESVKTECREDAEGGSLTVAIKMDDDQKVHNDDDAETVGAPGPRVLEHDTGATCLAITDDEHSESHLIMMAHSGATMSLATPSAPITPRDPSDSAPSHSGLRYCYYGKDDVTRQCQYWCQCGLVREDLREDSQTVMESNYLFDPLLRFPSPKPVEVQTRQDATDVLFQPSLERSGDSADTAVVVTVIIPRVKTEYYIRNDGASTTRNMTHDTQRGRRATGQGGYRGFRSRGRGGRGPRNEMT